jgi:hypothetical protein
VHPEPEKAPDYGTRLFLFNGVPTGAFFAHSILWMSGYPVTRCIHDLVFEIENLKNWRIPVGWFLPGHTLPRRDIISHAPK